jgi:hypothetical protein
MRCPWHLPKRRFLLVRQQNIGQNHYIKVANRSLENLSQFRYLGTNGAYQNLIQEVIKGRLNSGKDCCH